MGIKATASTEMISSRAARASGVSRYPMAMNQYSQRGRRPRSRMRARSGIIGT
jgi:hypothetical protein